MQIQGFFTTSSIGYSTCFKSIVKLFLTHKLFIIYQHMYKKVLTYLLTYLLHGAGSFLRS